MSAPRATPLNGGYDQNLLAVTPEVSKAARQEGYNVDLLREDGLPPQRNTAHRSTDLENGQHRAQPLYTKENYSGPIKPQKIPWWRTQTGIIAIVVILIVIIGAIVGGAVGGSVSHKGKTQVDDQPITTGNSSSVAVNGSGTKTDDKKSPDSGRTADSSKEAQTANSAPPTPPGQNIGPAPTPTNNPPSPVIRRAW